MAHYMAINKSGKNLPIFSGWPSVDKYIIILSQRIKVIIVL